MSIKDQILIEIEGYEQAKVGETPTAICILQIRINTLETLLSKLEQ